MTPVTNIDIDHVFFLVFLAAAGLASILSHCLLHKYLIASVTASFVASYLTGVCVSVYVVWSHISPKELSWLGEVYVPAFICAVPISFLVGLPFLLLRRRTHSTRAGDDKHLWEVPNDARLGLSILLFALFFCGIGLLYRQMQREQVEGTVYVAARNGTPADIQNAILIGGNLNSRLGYGTTPLMIAAFYGRTDNVAFLLKKGANPNVVCPRGETALKWAMQNKHSDVVILLRRAGARE